MQYSYKEYNKEDHDLFYALTVKQPYADRLVTPSTKDGNGIFYAEKSIEVRRKPTKYRGDVLICSAAEPVIPHLTSGAAIGLAELYDVKPLLELTETDWNDTTIPEAEQAKYKNGYAWFFRNPRRVIEMPVRGQLGIYRIAYSKGEIIEYPRICKVGDWTEIEKQIKTK